MATVFKMPGRPFWFAQITGADGTRLPRKSTKTTSKRDAVKIANDWESEERKKAEEGIVETRQTHRAFARIVENAARLAEDGKLTIDRAEEMIRDLRRLANPKFSEITVSDYWSKWIGRREKEVSESTSNNQKHALKKWETAMPDAMARPVTELTPESIRGGLAAMQTGTGAIATSTAGNYLSTLKEVLDAAIEERLLETNPARTRAVKQAKKSTATKATEKVGPFTLDEVRKLIAEATDEWQGMILFGFHTGLRMMDIAELGAVNLDGATLIRRSDKTETQTRTPLHPQLAEWVKGRGEWLFPKIRTMKKDNVSTTFSNLREKASVPKEITLPGGEKAKRSFHSLRHTFASILANADIPEEVRMNLTGQKTSAVHANYTHFDKATLSAAISKLPTL